MKCPKVQSVKATDNYILIVEFDNHETKKYDVTPLLEKEMFSPLKNTTLFKSVRVEQGGWAVSWNDEIDLSEFELWRHGKAVDEHHESGRQELVSRFSQKAIDEADSIWREKGMSEKTMDDWLKEKLDKRYAEYQKGQQNLHDCQAVHEGLRNKHK